MLRLVLLGLLLGLPAMAQESESPPISITSPDVESTYAHASVKSRSLIWDKATMTLIAEITFTDDDSSDSAQSPPDPHSYRLPGVTFDAKKKIFFATSDKGRVIPIAKIKKMFFLDTIEVLPNAHVRIMHPHGNVTVVLEAIAPDDPAMHAAPDNGQSHTVDLNQIVQ